MDLTIVRGLNAFTTRNDWFGDPLRFYVLASEYLFAVLVIVLVLTALIRRESLLESTGVRAGVSAALALAVGAAVSAATDRPRPFVTHRSANARTRLVGAQ